jgi:DNA-binding NarL/FixJ family response regulator
MDSSQKIKLYWAEEQELYQKLYSAIFTPDSPVTIAGSLPVIDFSVIKADLLRCHPDILLLGCQDLSIQVLNALGQIRASLPSTGIVLFSSTVKNADFMQIRQYLQKINTPFGYFLKKSLTHSEQIFNIISIVNAGQFTIDASILKFTNFKEELSQTASGLTPRETEILNLVSRGYSNIAISESLCIDVKTVRHHINNMYSKLKASGSFDHKHPRVSATNMYHKMTGQMSFNESIFKNESNS